ncbi:MAG: DUF5665 domain-containing protein [Candidatus Gracilibacteria bacterium]|nr:DUF5665 domain-containing protein [Candidatus Gracilibacteria bacterium]
MTELNADLQAASGRLLETTGAMQSFTQALAASQFREFVDYMGRPWYGFWFNLLIGVARGLGFVIGATVVVAFMVWIMSRVLNQLPVVGEFFDTLSQYLSQDHLEQIQNQSFTESFNQMMNQYKTNLLENYQTPTP